MKASHAHLHITEKEWDEMARVFKAVLDKDKVPAAEQQELFTIIGTTKAEIVAGGRPADAR
jgi:hemoglobin